MQLLSALMPLYCFLRDWELYLLCARAPRAALVTGQGCAVLLPSDSRGGTIQEEQITLKVTTTATLPQRAVCVGFL